MDHTLVSNICDSWALQRDRSLCVLSQTSHPEVAHIVPYAVGKTLGSLRDTQPDIFKLLRFLVGPTVVNRLSDYLLALDDAGTTRINRLENLICLQPGYHVYFRRGLFVLEPVGDPLSALTLEQGLWTYEVTFNWVPTNRPCPIRSQGRSGAKPHEKERVNARATRLA